MKTILSEAGIHDLRENLKRRGESFKEGIYLLIEHLKKIGDEKFIDAFLNNYEKIVDNIDEFYEKYVGKMDDTISFEEGEQNLSSLLSDYKQLLQENTSLSKPFESLCLAERCAVWKTGRKALDTIVKKANLK